MTDDDIYIRCGVCDERVRMADADFVDLGEEDGNAGWVCNACLATGEVEVEGDDDDDR